MNTIIINIINREYCKKLIIVLPGQYHPVHAHKVKEETFQLLYGDLKVNIEGKDIFMEPGDIQNVLRGEKHSFTSVKGAIFEEVSNKPSSLHKAILKALRPYKKNILKTLFLLVL